MRWAAIILTAFLAVAPARAGDIIVIQPPKDGDPEWVVGRIYYFNGLTLANVRHEVITLAVPGYGDIVLQAERKPNHNCPGGCPDFLQVVAVPDGVVVDAEVTRSPVNGSSTTTIFDVNLLPMS